METTRTLCVTSPSLVSVSVTLVPNKKPSPRICGERVLFAFELSRTHLPSLPGFSEPD
jgi:hypothetical protein